VYVRPIPLHIRLTGVWFAVEQLVKKYERGDLPKSDWLDKMAFRKMEEIHAVSAHPIAFSLLGL
jgi:hypothetical protein